MMYQVVLCPFCSVFFPCKNIYLVGKLKKKIDFHNKISALSTKNSLMHLNVDLNIYIFQPHPPHPKNGQTPDYKYQLCLVYKTFPEEGQETQT